MLGDEDGGKEYLLKTGKKCKDSFIFNTKTHQTAHFYKNEILCLAHLFRSLRVFIPLWVCFLPINARIRIPIGQAKTRNFG